MRRHAIKSFNLVDRSSRQARGRWFCWDYPIAKTPTAGWRGGFVETRFEDEVRSPDVVEGIVDGALLWPALMLFKIGLQLRFGLVGIRYKFASCPER
jgi:hypothetical protein